MYWQGQYYEVRQSADQYWLLAHIFSMEVKIFHFKMMKDRGGGSYCLLPGRVWSIPGYHHGLQSGCKVKIWAVEIGFAGLAGWLLGVLYSPLCTLHSSTAPQLQPHCPLNQPRSTCSQSRCWTSQWSLFSKLSSAAQVICNGQTFTSTSNLKPEAKSPEKY